MPSSSPEKQRIYYVRYTSKPGVRERRNAVERLWYAANREHVAVFGKQRRRRKRAQTLVTCARVRARRLGVPFSLGADVAELQRRIDKGFCELTGLPFDLDGVRCWASPSLDRIEPKLGYVLSNVRIVCWGMNLALSNWGEETLLMMVRAWLYQRSMRSLSYKRRTC